MPNTRVLSSNKELSPLSKNTSKLYAIDEEKSFVDISNKIIEKTEVMPPSFSFNEELSQLTILCDQSDVDIYYSLDNTIPTTSSFHYSKPFILSRNSNVAAVSYLNGISSYINVEKFNSLANLQVGDTYIKDGIMSICVYKADSVQEWGQYLFTDKDHDLCYYITGDDYFNNTNYNVFPGTYGYEWGGYGTTTGITSISLGDGLNNTNSLIERNLSSETSGWRLLWDMVKQFRESHSDDWFVPTLNEIQQVYGQRSLLNNISITTNSHPYYWTSSEVNSNGSYLFDFYYGNAIGQGKSSHYYRCRLCWTI